MTTSQQNVPVLRFKDERGNDYPEWEEKKLGELGNFKNGVNKDKSEFGFGTPLINLMDVFGKQTLNSQIKLGAVNATQKEIQNYNLKRGDVIFIRSSVKRSGVGEAVVVSEDLPNAVFSGFLIRFRQQKISIGVGFLKYCFWTERFRKTLVSLSTTSANTNINQESIKLVKVTFPELEEQQKITTFLSSVDTKIEQLNKKKALWEQYKKGMMQKLFSQDIRFKDEQGEEYSKWEKQCIGDIATIIMGTSPRSSAYNQNNEGLPLIQGNADVKNRKSAPRMYTSEITKVCLPNDTLISVRAPVGDVSKAVHRACLGRGMAVIRANSDVLQNFLYNYLILYESKWRRVSQGSTFESVNSNNVRAVSIYVPSMIEQQKIANFLSAIHRKIERVDTQIKHTQTFKKGLLQQMFI